MSAAAELISALERAGGSLALEDGTVKVAYPAEKKKAVRPIVNGLRAHRDEVRQILAGGRVKGSMRPGVDPYWQRADRALKRICARPYFPGAIQWLKRSNPSLHRMLTRDLPKQIDKLWDAQAPLDHFEAVLAFWVDTHGDAVDQYLKAMGNGKTSASSKGQILASHEESEAQVNERRKTKRRKHRWH